MNGVTFHHPWLLAALPLVVIVYIAWVYGTRRAIHRARSVARAGAGRPRYVAAGLLAMAAAAGIVAAAQPRWGTEQSQIPRNGAELVIVLDLSRSMDAKDVTPSRLEATKTALEQTIRQLDGDRVGLVVFAGSARLRFPLTTDTGAASQVVASLQTGTVYVTGGTNSSIGLDTALSAFDLSKKAGRAVLFISDGDDLGSDPSQSAVKLNAAGIRLMVAGAGTPAGGTVPVTNANTGKVTDKTDASGAPLISHLNEPFLRALAAAASGRYLGSDLSVIPGLVKGQLEALQQSQVESESTTIPIERYQWFVAAALILLLLASLAEYLSAIRWPSRRAAAMAVTTMLLLLPACATQAYNATERGREAFRAGDVDAAVGDFQQAASGHSDDPVADLNLAAALYGAQRFDEAIIAARRALNSNDGIARGEAYASVAHSQFAAGRLSDALDSFKHALLENPADAASRHDYEVVLQLSGASNPPQSPAPSGTSPTPAPSATPGPSQPGPGDSGDSTDDNGADASATPGPTDTPSRNESDIATELKGIDDQVQQILNESNGAPNAEQALKILQLLDQRTRIAQLRDPGGANSGPNDY